MAPESTLVIRPLRPGDAEAVSALYEACLDTIRLPQYGGGRDFLKAVEDGERVAGSARVGEMDGIVRSATGYKSRETTVD